MRFVRQQRSRHHRVPDEAWEQSFPLPHVPEVVDVEATLAAMEDVLADDAEEDEVLED